MRKRRARRGKVQVRLVSLLLGHQGSRCAQIRDEHSQNGLECQSVSWMISLHLSTLFLVWVSSTSSQRGTWGEGTVVVGTKRKLKRSRSEPSILLLCGVLCFAAVDTAAKRAIGGTICQIAFVERVWCDFFVADQFGDL